MSLRYYRITTQNNGGDYASRVFTSEKEITGSLDETVDKETSKIIRSVISGHEQRIAEYPRIPSLQTHVPIMSED